MPYIQPKLNNYFGLMPVSAGAGTLIECNPYAVSSSEASDINIGDVVVQTSKNTVRVITGAFNPTSSMAVVGAAASFLAAGTGSTGAFLNSNTSQMVLVYDSPNQRFVICDTTSASAGTETALYKNYAILATGCIGSTGASSSLHRSVQALSGVTSTALGGFHILSLHPIENGQYSSGGAGTAVTSSGVSKWIGVFTAAVTLQGLSSANLNTIANTTS
jgi:hypothetical protein